MNWQKVKTQFEIEIEWNWVFKVGCFAWLRA